MKKIAVTLAGALVFGLASFAMAAEMTAPKPIELKDKVSVTATIEAIDHSNRMVTLKGPKGNVVDLYVDESVKRFDALKVGDKVTADYVETVTFEIQQPGAAAVADKVVQGGGKLSGAKPGGGVMETTVTTVTVMAIDKATPAVTIKTSDGAIQSYRVRHRENLEKVKVGDKVVVTQTSSLMVSVAPAK